MLDALESRETLRRVAASILFFPREGALARGRQVNDEGPEEGVKPTRGIASSLQRMRNRVGAKTGKSANDRPGVSEPEGH